MGKVLVAARIENIGDLHGLDQGTIAPEAVRTVTLTDALIDTGATGLSMPASLLAGLGLKYLRPRTARTSGGEMQVRLFGTVRLTIQGRDYPTDVTELPDGCPVLIGQIPLEAMDFVVDMTKHRLIGKPEHAGEHVIELY